MAGAGGPRKRMLDAVSASAAGSSGFSDAWPLPQHMSFPVIYDHTDCHATSCLSLLPAAVLAPTQGPE